MHPEGHGDVTGLTKCGVLRRIMPLTEVIDAVAGRRFEGVDVGLPFTRSGNTHK